MFVDTILYQKMCLKLVHQTPKMNNYRHFSCEHTVVFAHRIKFGSFLSTNKSIVGRFVYSMRRVTYARPTDITKILKRKKWQKQKQRNRPQKAVYAIGRHEIIIIICLSI